MKLIAAAFFVILFAFVFSPTAVAYEDDYQYQAEEDEIIDEEIIDEEIIDEEITDEETIPPPDDQIDTDEQPIEPEVQTFDIANVQASNINRLTGLPINPAFANNRPIAVSFNSARAALPQHGISQADIIYEMLIEGGMTRMFALFLDVSNVGNIGSIRSIRPYMHFIGLSYRAIYAHGGGSPEAMRLITNFIDRLDGVGGPGAGAFFRNPIPNRAFEHTLFTTGARINSEISTLGIPRQQNIPNYVERLAFTAGQTSAAGGRSAAVVDVTFSANSRTLFRHCTSSNRYHVYLHGSIPYVDGNNNARVAVTNILVLQMNITGTDYAGRLSIETVGTGRGYFINGGRAIEINWRRPESWYQFEYYIRNSDGSNGPELILGQGRTYICIVPNILNVSFTEGRGWVRHGAYWLYILPNGSRATGWRHINNVWYHFDGNGIMHTGGPHQIGGRWFLFNSSGAMQTGWRNVGGRWFFFESSGAAITGWRRINNVWYHFDGNGVMRTGGPHQIGGRWFIFNSSGAMQTGWRNVGGRWYFFESSGAAATGWRHINNVWYHFDGNGIMRTGGPHQIGGRLFLFNSSGAMQTGWRNVRGSWYFFQPSGAAAIGWRHINDVWYFFEPTGVMVTGRHQIGGVWHLFNSSGAWRGRG